jgi:SHS2 domain-containing protein
VEGRVADERTEGYQVLSHTADTGVSARAASLSSLIRLLATGMCELMATFDPERATESVAGEVASDTIEDLVVDSLSEILYLSETKDLALGDIRVEVDEERLTATIEARGVPVDSVETTGPPVKAVTYHGLVVAREGKSWRGQVYLDV